jgi:DNA processing protein
MDNFKKELILLNMVEGIGYIRFKALLDEFKDPRNIFKAPISRLKSIKSIGTGIAEAIKNAYSKYDIDKEVGLIKGAGVKIVTLFDSEYPECLRTIYDPPILLYIKGDFRKEDELSIAIVGSRRCTYYGLNMAEKIASELVKCNVVIISGLARGIDTAAHKGAVKNNGRTIAVLGNGLGSIYPVENKELAERILHNGLLVSEFPMEAKPYKKNFPRRNRIISGLSKGLLVVEAAKKSGALITADFALEQGRDVFAVPGMADRFSSNGTNALIKQGAKLVESADDILEELGIDKAEPVAERAYKNGGSYFLENPDEKNIFNILSDKPSDIDTIIRKLEIKTQQAKLMLLNMEMKGIIKQLPGKLYVRE